MVSFDSKTKTLTFKKQYNLNGEVAWSAGVNVDLSHFDEVTRQFMIGLAKQAINFANGHKTIEHHVRAANKAKVKEENSETKPEKVKVEENNSNTEPKSEENKPE